MIVLREDVGHDSGDKRKRGKRWLLCELNQLSVSDVETLCGTLGVSLGVGSGLCRSISGLVAWTLLTMVVPLIEKAPLELLARSLVKREESKSERERQAEEKELTVRRRRDSRFGFMHFDKYL